MRNANISKSAARISTPPETGASALRIGGFTPFSAVDFPGKLAAVVFCQGCPLRCGYCHNTHLIPADSSDLLSFAEVFAALRARRFLLDAVVFSGGEPLAQSAVVAAMAAAKAEGFAVGLHTSGIHLRTLAKALAYLDWVGFDVKAPFDDYSRVAGIAAGEKVSEALDLLLASRIECEIRTTVQPFLIGADEIRRIAFALHQRGVRRYVLQEARTPDRRPWPGETALEDSRLLAELAAQFPDFEVRHASD